MKPSDNKSLPSVRSADLVAVDHQVVCGGEGFKHNHPAGVGSPLKQGVSQLRDVHVHLVGALNQIWGENKASNRNECPALQPPPAL